MKPTRKRRGRGEGSIFPYKGGYAAQVTIGYDPETHKQRRKTVYGNTKKEVQDKLRDLQNQKADRTLDTSKMTVKQFLEYWLAHAVEDAIDEGTVDLYRARVHQHIVPFVGSVRLDRLTDRVIDQFLLDLKDKGRSTDLRKKVGELLRRALTYALEKGWVRENAAKKSRLPSVRVRKPHPLDEVQVRKFLSTAEKNRLHPLYVLALDTGMRQGEIMALEWTDVDLDGGYVSVTKSVKTGGKGGPRVKEVKTEASRRRIKMTRRTVELLAIWRETTPGKIVFPTRGKGKTYGQDAYLSKAALLRSFKKLLTNVGLDASKVRFHDLRHTHATLALQKTRNIKAISVRLGHKDIRVTLQVYASWVPAMEDDIVTAFEAILSPEMPDSSVAVRQAVQSPFTEKGLGASPIIESSLSESEIRRTPGDRRRASSREELVPGSGRKPWRASGWGRRSRQRVDAVRR
jgi:integrase